jgi:predicted AAA+ superfamily ATPase
MIKREQYLKFVEKALKRNPVVALIGPRQYGKTTLTR